MYGGVNMDTDIIEDSENEDLNGHPDTDDMSEASSNDTSKIPSVLDPYMSGYTKVEFGNNVVYQNNSLFDRDYRSSWQNAGQKITGSNKERMQSGRAAIGIEDNKPINLHHIFQTQNGPIIELSQTFHQENFSALHKNTGGFPSQINRSAFGTWRTSYWIDRGKKI